MSVVAGTAPYPWPFDGRLRPRRLALVVAGADEWWSGRVPDPDDWARTIAELAGTVAAAGARVFTVVHPAAVAEAHALPIPGAVSVAAAGVDGFYGGALDDLLRAAGCTQLALAGFGLEGPVHSTLRSANDRGYECLTLRDACAPLDPGLAAAAFSSIEMSGGIFGATGTSSALCAALDAHPTKESP